jgi:hypothetical protein
MAPARGDCRVACAHTPMQARLGAVVRPAPRNDRIIPSRVLGEGDGCRCETAQPFGQETYNAVVWLLFPLPSGESKAPYGPVGRMGGTQVEDPALRLALLESEPPRSRRQGGDSSASLTVPEQGRRERSRTAKGGEEGALQLQSSAEPFGPIICHMLLFRPDMSGPLSRTTSRLSNNP